MTDRIRWGLENPHHPLSQMKTELIWEGEYDEYGNRRTVDNAGCATTLLPAYSLPRRVGRQVRTQTGCTTVQAGGSACWTVEHGMKCLCWRE